ncbi:hypothetical protein B5P43_31830 [Bacillus sp. SRB_336]|nr:hypothetical protein B5P43_31830 [Bacillus sp. SRB_336]
MTATATATRPPKGFKIDAEAARAFTAPEAAGPTVEAAGGALAAGAAWTATEGITYWLNATEAPELTRADLTAIHGAIGRLLADTAPGTGNGRSGPADLMAYVNTRMEALPTILTNWQAGYEQAMLDVRRQLATTVA